MLRHLLILARSLAIFAALLICSQSATAQNQSFSVYPENEIVLKGIAGTISSEQLTLVNNLDREITITAEYMADAQIGIDLPSKIVMKAKEKASYIITFTGQGEAKGYIVLTEGNTATRILVRGTTATEPTESIKVPEYVTFGPVASGKSLCMPIEVTNTSNKPLTIDYALAGYSKGAFNIPTDNIPRLTLQAGETGKVSICFEPQEFDSKEELIFTYSNDGGTTNQTRSTWLLGMIERDIDPNTPCLSTNEKVGIGPVMLGRSAEGKIYLANQTDKPIVITGATISGPAPACFTIADKLPLTVDARSKIEMTVVFTPEQEGNNSAEIELTLQSEIAECKTALIYVTGWTTTKTVDNSRYPIFLTEKKTLGIEWGPNTIMQKVIFYNNLDHEVAINDVKLRDGIDFRLVQTTPTVPCTLKPDENLVLVLATGMDGKPYFTDEIIFVTDQDAAGESNYDLQGVKQSASVYDAGNREIELSVGPNPVVSNLNITVGNVASATITIYDLTGKLVASADATNYTWNASTNHAAGTYFVTVSGVTISGKPFNDSRRVVVE
jgi:hypothetical protein